MRVVISGASSGIGEALARYYAPKATALGLICRRKPTLSSSHIHYAVDVTNTGEIRKAADDYVARYGAPDVVIANAGIGAGTSAESLADVDVLRGILDVNVAGLAATLAAFAPAMRSAGRGTLAGIASVAGFRGLAGNSAYCASKAAAIAWLESLRVEMRGSGVSVVCVCPGYIDTPMTRVNRFRMPFLLDADKAVAKIARAIEQRRRLAVIPWQMAAVSVLLRALPGFLFDPLAARAPRKPREKTL